MANEILLSRTGHEKLVKELEELKGPVRAQIAEAIRDAKSHGDLRENAAYHEAKLNQTRLESRIADLEKVLQFAKVIDRPDTGEAIAHLGSKIRLFDEAWKEEMQVTLVGSYEADPTQEMFSITSPMGSALLGKGVGDEVEVEAPAGKQRYKILAID